MTAIEKYKKAMEIADRIRLEIMSDIKSSFSDIPDIKGLKRNTFNGVKSFSISAKDLSSVSWLPQYYDNKMISERICKHLQNAKSLEQISKYLNEIVITQKVDGDKINPEMVKHIENIVKKFEL